MERFTSKVSYLSTMKLKTIIFFLFFGIAFQVSAEKLYQKEFYPNGQIKSEGWMKMDSKTDYWYFYHPNGKVASKGTFRNNKKHGYWYFYSENGLPVKEGHFILGSAENWWIFYDSQTEFSSKFQFKNNKKNGFALRYKKKRLIKAEKYINNKKEGEWTSVLAFKRDNPEVKFR